MPRIYYYDKFKICREFIIMINSDVFKNLLIYIVNSKVELMLTISKSCSHFFYFRLTKQGILVCFRMICPVAVISFML